MTTGEKVAVVTGAGSGIGKGVALALLGAGYEVVFAGRRGEVLRAPDDADIARVLPEYMVPSSFLFLDALPLTPNGKVDRRALPEPELRPELELTFVAPRTPIEEMLANIWASVLGIEKVGVHNNFFDLGGDSIIEPTHDLRAC